MTEIPGLVQVLIALGAVFAFLAIASQIKAARLTETVSETERGLIYRHGKFQEVVGPGRHWMLFGRTMEKVSMSERLIAVSNQEILSADRMPVKASALVTYRVTDPRVSVEKSVGGHHSAVYYDAQLALREVLAELPLEALIDARTKLDPALTDCARAAFAAQGCELVSFALRDVVLPAEVRRLATDVTRAKMEAAASLERARGEQATLRLLNNAARLLKGNPELMNLRLLQVLAPGPGKTPPTVILGTSPGIVPLQSAGQRPGETPETPDAG